jgi:Uma2 family endonuclease
VDEVTSPCKLLPLCHDIVLQWGWAGILIRTLDLAENQWRGSLRGPRHQTPVLYIVVSNRLSLESIMNANAAVAASFTEMLNDLGGIPIERVCMDPAPGHATIEDLLRLNGQGGMFELVDATLVEKAMGWRESLIAMVLGRFFSEFVAKHNHGLVSGPDGFMRILRTQVRGPDVAFVSWERLPEGRVPEAAIPEIIPDIAVEVLSEGNTYAEMSRKRREYFHAGVRQVWMVDLIERTVAVYTDIMKYEMFDEDAQLSGGDILPGLVIPLSEVFRELDRKHPEQA